MFGNIEPSGAGVVTFFDEAPPQSTAFDQIPPEATTTTVTSTVDTVEGSETTTDVTHESNDVMVGTAQPPLPLGRAVKIVAPIVPAVCMDRGVFSPPPKTAQGSSGSSVGNGPVESMGSSSIGPTELFADPVRGQGVLKLFASAPPTAFDVAPVGARDDLHAALHHSSSLRMPPHAISAFPSSGTSSFDELTAPSHVASTANHQDANALHAAVDDSMDASSVDMCDGDIVMEGAFEGEEVVVEQTEVVETLHTSLAHTHPLSSTMPFSTITAAMSISASVISTDGVVAASVFAHEGFDDSLIVEEIPLQSPLPAALLARDVAELQKEQGEVDDRMGVEGLEDHITDLSSSDISVDSSSPSGAALSPSLMPPAIDVATSAGLYVDTNEPDLCPPGSSIAYETQPIRSDFALPNVASTTTVGPSTSNAPVIGGADSLFPAATAVGSKGEPGEGSSALYGIAAAVQTSAPRPVPSTVASKVILRVASGHNLASADTLFGGPSPTAAVDPFGAAPIQTAITSIARPMVMEEASSVLSPRAADSLFGGSPHTATQAASLFDGPSEPFAATSGASHAPIISGVSAPAVVTKVISPALSSAASLFSNPQTGTGGDVFGSTASHRPEAPVVAPTPSPRSVQGADTLFGAGPSSGIPPFGFSAPAPPSSTPKSTFAPAGASDAKSPTAAAPAPPIGSVPRPGAVVPKIIKGGVALRPSTDAPGPFSSGGDVSELFGAPASGAFGAAPGVDSLFTAPPRASMSTPVPPASFKAPAATPPVAPVTGAGARPSAQTGLLPATFFSAAPTGPSIADAFSAPPPGSKSAHPSKTTSATDIFSRAAPVTAAPVVVDPFSPPVAPGVRIAPIAPPVPHPAATSSSSTVSAASPMQSPTATTVGVPHIPAVTFSPAGVPLPPGTVVPVSAAAPPPSSATDARPRGVASNDAFHAASHAPAVPEGMIPTPHGYVPARTAPSGAPGRTAPVGPQFAPSGSVAVPPGIHPSVGASSGAPHPQVSAANRFGSASTKGPAYRFPQPCSLVRFGFGGKVVALMTRSEAYGGAIGHQSGFTPTLGGPAVTARSVRPLPLRVHRLVDLIGRACGYGDSTTETQQYGYKDVRKIELRRMLDLVNSFPGPLTPSSKQADVAAFMDKVSRQQSLRESLSSVYVDPSCAPASLNDIGGGGNDSKSSEHLLWALLRVLVENNGSVQSDDGLADPQSPESRILALLFEDAQARVADASAFIGGATRASAPAAYADIEGLLLNGKREDALKLAVEKEDFALALLIASVCGKEQFQFVSRCYAEKNFAVTSSLHFLSMLYSNQAEKSLKHGGARLLNTVASTDVGGGALAGGSAVVSQWRKHLAAILSNKNQNWADLVRTLADRILNDTHDAALAHFVAITAGNLPSGSAGEGKYTLVGCLPSKAAASAVGDALSIMGLRMSEIIEWSVCRGAGGKGSGLSGSKSSPSLSSFTSLLGLGTSSKPPSGAKQAQQPAGAAGQSHVSMERVLRMRGALCAPKLRFAMWLADLGLTDAALAYACDVRDTVRVSNTSAAPRGPNDLVRPDSAPSGNPFTALFCKSVDEFCDRIGGGKAAVSSRGASSELISGSFNESGTSGGGGLWGGIGGVINNVLSSSNLKDFVDGPSATAPTSTPPMNFPPTSAPNQRVAPPMPSPPMPPGAVSKQQPSQSMYPGGVMPPTYPFGVPGGNGAPPHTQPYVSEATGPGAGVAPFGGYPQPMTPQYPNSNQYPPQLQEQQHQQAPQQMQQQQPQQAKTKLHVSHSSPSLSSQTASSSSSSSVSPTRSAGPPSSPGSAPKDSSSSESSTSGVVHKVRKGLFKWLYPDAHDTTENMGNKLEAYFDKATGKWVFPGEENNAANDPASAPPPIMPMPSAAPPATAAKPSSSADDGAYDPLAALMAPPPRSMAVSSVAMPSLTMPGAGLPPGAPPLGMGGPPPSIGTFAFPKPQVMAVPPFGGGGVAPFGASPITTSPAVAPSDPPPAMAPELGASMPPPGAPQQSTAPHPFGFPSSFDPSATSSAVPEYTEYRAEPPVPSSDTDPAGAVSSAPPSSHQSVVEELPDTAPAASTWSPVAAEPPGQPEWL